MAQQAGNRWAQGVLAGGLSQASLDHFKAQLHPRGSNAGVLAAAAIRKEKKRAEKHQAKAALHAAGRQAASLITPAEEQDEDDGLGDGLEENSYTDVSTAGLEELGLRRHAQIKHIPGCTWRQIVGSSFDVQCFSPDGVA